MMQVYSPKLCARGFWPTLQLLMKKSPEIKIS